MPSVYDLKPRFQALLRPLVGGLRRVGITPNGITLLAMAGSIAVGVALARASSTRLLLLLPAWLFIRMALNAIDGMMAREHDLTSKLGGVLNELGDVVSDIALYLPLAAATSPWPVAVFVMGAIVTEFAGVLTQALGGGRQYQGPMGKSDRAFWVGALATGTALRPATLSVWPIFFWVASGLTVITVLNRVRAGLKRGSVNEVWTTLDAVPRMGVLVAGLLLLATLIVLALRVLHPRWNLSEVHDRLRSWWVMAGIFIGAVLVHPGAVVVLVGLLSFWALKEFVTLLETRPADHAALVLAFLAVPVQFYWVWIGWYGMFIVFIPVYVFLLIPLRLVLTGETKGFIRSAAEIQWGTMAFVFGLSHLAYLVKQGPVTGPAAAQVDGRSLLLFLVFVVEINDILQFCWGKALGRHKVIPAISPNKTWEGLVGGIATTMALSLTIRFLTPFTAVECLLVAGGVATLGFFGDIVLSAVKRDFGVKDFSAALPGHGGLLDRIDSLCYAAPVFFHYVRYVHYGP